MFRIILPILAVVFLFPPISSFASKETDKYVFLGNYNIPPIVYMQNGEATGLVVDIAQTLAHKSKLDIEVQVMNWGEAQSRVLQGKADALLQINKNSKRLRQYDFSEPLLESRFSIFRKNSRLDIQNIKSLFGRTVGVEDSGYPILLLKKYPQIKIKKIANWKMGFEMVNRGKIDAILVDRWVGEYELALNGIQGITIVDKPVEISYSHIAVKKGNLQLLGRINKGLKRMREDGSMDQILNKWSKQEIVYLSRENLNYVLIIGVSIILFTLLSFIFFLRTEVKRKTKGLHQEIEERKQVEEKLQIERDISQNYLDIAGVIFVAIDNNQNVTLINNKGCDILECDKNEIIGKNWFDNFLSEFDRDRVKAAFEKLMAGDIEPVEYFKNSIITKRGKEIIIAWHNTVLIDSNNNIIGTLSSGEDVTDRKRIEEERQKIHKLESIGILAGGIAHDFNNLLAAIRNNIYLSMMHVDRENIAYEKLESTENIIHRATNLTQQLLTFSKGGAPVKKTASIIALIKETAEFVLRGSNVNCEYNVADDICTIEVDEGQMHQVIHNLVLNADQSMPQGGTIQIHVENFELGPDTGFPLKEEKYVKVLIQDQGIGIEKEQLKNIFDPYFTTKEMGRGLGLSITYSIIKQHDGLLTVESEKRTGTTFTIYLPASEKQVEEKETAGDTFIAGEGKVLVMDDEEIIRESVEQLLTLKGYEIECAKDGDEAIALYKKAMEASKPFDAVILDLTIRGGMGGKEAVKKLLEIDSGVKAIVASGYSNDPVLANYRDYGFCGVFAKHDKAEELGKTLHKVINRYQ